LYSTFVLCILFAKSDLVKTLHYIATTEQQEYTPLQFQKCDFEANYIFANNNKTTINKRVRFCNPIANKEIIPTHIKITFDKNGKKDLLPLSEDDDYATFNISYKALLFTKFHIVAHN
jgi:hypothetical protein